MKVDPKALADKLERVPEAWLPEIGVCLNVTFSASEFDAVINALRASSSAYVPRPERHIGYAAVDKHGSLVRFYMGPPEALEHGLHLEEVYVYTPHAISPQRTEGK